LGTLYYLKNGQSYELQILYALSYDRSQQKPIKNLGKSSRGRSQDSRKFSGHPYVGLIMGHLCDSSAFLFAVRFLLNDTSYSKSVWRDK